MNNLFDRKTQILHVNLCNIGCDFIAGKGGGVIQGTASEAVLVVLLAARDKILRRVGRNALPKLVMYASDQTHSALLKAWQVPPMTHKNENNIIIYTQ